MRVLRSSARLLAGVQPESRMAVVLRMWGAKGLQAALPVVYIELSLFASVQGLAVWG